MKYPASVVKQSKLEALAKIEQFLQAEDVEGQFANRKGGYYSDDKFIVTWKGNWQGIPSEYGIDKTDIPYQWYSGMGAVYCTRSLFHEKQLGAYHTIWRALIEIGLKLSKDKKGFFDKYAPRYNEWVRSQDPSKACSALRNRRGYVFNTTDNVRLI